VSALLLIPRNGSINETAGQTNPAAPLVSKERSVTSSPQTQRKQEKTQERERERGRLEFRSLVAGEVSAGQLKRKAPKERQREREREKERERESDVSSARAGMDDRAFSRFSRRVVYRESGTRERKIRYREDPPPERLIRKTLQRSVKANRGVDDPSPRVESILDMFHGKRERSVLRHPDLHRDEEPSCAALEERKERFAKRRDPTACRKNRH